MTPEELREFFVRNGLAKEFDMANSLAGDIEALMLEMTTEEREFFLNRIEESP